MSPRHDLQHVRLRPGEGHTADVPCHPIYVTWGTRGRCTPVPLHPGHGATTRLLPQTARGGCALAAGQGVYPAPGERYRALHQAPSASFTGQYQPLPLVLGFMAPCVGHCGVVSAGFVATGKRASTAARRLSPTSGAP